jgi:hypothetical protein
MRKNMQLNIFLLTVKDVDLLIKFRHFFLISIF